ncbi:ATP-dependent helicase HrpB [Fodinicurvata halophila]|uniref:ATP-dependent helicase HrpB n=1 Tax=Fodinicurvata halophila TaxID=1419723 RepID=UPI0036355B10
MESEGREFPVETRYLPTDTRTRSTLCSGVAQAVQTALQETSGSLLVFLPGEAEIRQTLARLEDSLSHKRVLLHPLFGSLSQDKQKAALAPPPSGQRKVVLATSIAESSLTIEGVSTVIDSGLGRRPVFDPARGMSRLETRRISRASADQRRGRAGRLGPGTCYRLWAEEQDRALIAFDPPEIQTADLTSLVLELAAWGCRTWHELNWIDPPPSAAFAQAQDLLVQLGALQPDGSITRHGRSMVEVGVAPRYAHMILKAREFEASRTACDLAALLDERDILRRRGQGAPVSDLRQRLELLADPEQAGGADDLDKGALKRCRQASGKLRRQLSLSSQPSRPDLAGELVALAYPDRVARRRGGSGGYLMRNGRGVELPEDDPLTTEEWVAIAHLDDRPGNARAFLAAPLSLPRLEALFEADLELQRRVEWSSRENEVLAREEWRLGALVLRSRRLDQVAPDEMRAALLQAVRDKGLRLLPWTDEARQLQARLAFMRSRDPEGRWPDVDDSALLSSLEDWLAPYLVGAQRLQDLETLDIRLILYSLLDHAQQKRLDSEAPENIAVPSGALRRIDYTPEEGPVLPVKLQEMFGATETPRIMNGRLSLILHLLSPAGRPLQVTQNLESFWQEGYRHVRAEMRGRYPKHPWPENPLDAAPTASTKRRKSQ